MLNPELLPDPVQEAMAEYGRVGGPRPEPEDDEAQGAPDEGTLRELLLRHQGNVAAVGRELGKARMQIHRWMKRYAIDVGDYRSHETR